jgi:SanA protein
MLRLGVKMFYRLALALLILIPLVTLWPRLFATWNARRLVYSVESAPVKRVAIVFGAGLWRDGSPTPVLRDRVATAAQLYMAGKVEKLLMSGDNRFDDYNEPAAMQAYAVQLGIPNEDIVLDYAGRRTYDTCYRAREIFAVQEAILVTQSFHLPRALYICNTLDLPAIGVPADQRIYRKRSLVFWNLRELPATMVALWEVHVSKPLPVLGNPEPIFPMEAQ